MMLNRICDLAFSLSKNYQKKKSGKKKKDCFPFKTALLHSRDQEQNAPNA